MRDHSEKLEFDFVGFLSLEAGARFSGKEANVVHRDAHLINKNLDVAVVFLAPLLRRTEIERKQPEVTPSGCKRKDHHTARARSRKQVTGGLVQAHIGINVLNEDGISG